MPTHKPLRIADFGVTAGDFWRRQSRVSLEPGCLKRGNYQIELHTGAAAYATLEVSFSDDDHPPLQLPLSVQGDSQMSCAFRLHAPSRALRLIFEPPLEPSELAAPRLSRMPSHALLAPAIRKAFAHLHHPTALARRVYAIARGVSSVSLTPPHLVQGHHAAAGLRTQAIMERALARARAEFAERSLRHRALAIYDTRTNCPAAFLDFLQGTPVNDADGPVKVLVLEHATAPLDAQARRFAEAQGVEILRLEGEDVAPFSIIGQRPDPIDAFFFLEQPGTFHPAAIPALLLALDDHPDALAVYADADRLSQGGTCSDPKLKPGWSPTFALADNYVGQPVLFRNDSSLANEARASTDPLCPSYDLLLRIQRLRPIGGIQNVPCVLFHKRVDGVSQRYQDRVREAEDKLVGDHLARMGQPAAVNSVTGPTGRTVRHIRHDVDDANTKVSVIIPTRDNPDMLRKAIASAQAGGWGNLEVIIVDNGSETSSQKTTLDNLRGTPGVTILSRPQPFNFSRLINAGREAARGDILLLLNDDVEAIENTRWLKELASLSAQDEVGCVGAHLFYADGSLQHAGIVLGLHGSAGHIFRHTRAEQFAELNKGEWLDVSREVSAVTAACLCVRASVFDAVGGFNENLPVAMNDVDFCLRVREAGWRNLVTPHARLTHRESTTRGLDMTPARLKRLARENARFLSEWGPGVLDDPNYHPHLSRFHEDARLRTDD